MRPGDIIADRFEIERLGGSGGMGAVYCAVDRRTGRRVALKVLWAHLLDVPEHTERFAREAKVLADLQHPGIVRYVDHGQTPDGELYLALEWLEGESLAQRLRRQWLTVAESIALMHRIADALGAAHRRGVVHRDLKPSNIYLVDESIERPKLLDFGIARLVGGSVLTVTGVLVGTPFYMAPEQARCDQRIDARADVFALGCVLYHCLTGRAPFANEEMHAALLKVVLDDAPRLSTLRDDVPPALDDLTARMLAKRPEDRPADAGVLAEEFAALEALADSPAALTMRKGALTAVELRVVCAVLVRVMAHRADGVGAPLPGDISIEMELPATLPMWERDPRRSVLTTAITRHLGHIESMASGVLLVTVTSAGASTDQGARAARCALAIRAVLPEAPMALVAGRGTANGRRPVDEVIVRGTRMLDSDPQAAPAPIRIDDMIAGLLGARFDVDGDSAGLILRRERDVVEPARTLLGKPTACVGRDHELGILEAVLEECISEPTGRAVLVTAGAGIGKSRLFHEFLRRVQARPARVQVWAAQGDPMSAGSPFGMLAQILRRAAGLREGEPTEVRQQKLRARISRHLSGKDAARVTEFLGELLGVPFPDRESVELRAARHDPMLMGDQMRSAWEDLLIAECAAQPVLIVLEDLHWGDLPTIKFIDATLRGLHDRPLMVLALARPEVHDLFPKMWASRGVQELRLRELNRKGCEKLVHQVLGDAIDPAMLARIVERAAGNAFYLEELIRAAAVGDSSDLPETVLAMVQARLDGLLAEERRVLRAASVFGQVFWRAGLVPLLGDKGASSGSLADWLSDLVERELIIRRGEGKFPGQEEYAFRHALVREGAYATLTDEDRTLGHRLGGEWLEQIGEREASILAQHFERGGEPGRAVVWYRRAAEQALEGNDFQAAIARAESGADYADGEVLGALRLLQAEAHKWLGSAAEAERCAESAMDRFSVGSPLWYVAASEAASMRLRLGKHAELAALAEEVRSLGSTPALALDVPLGDDTRVGPSLSPVQVAAGLPVEGAGGALRHIPAPTASSPSHDAPGRKSIPPPAQSSPPPNKSIPPLAFATPSAAAAVSALARLAGSLLHDGQRSLAEALIGEIDRVAGPIAEHDYAVRARVYALRASRALCSGDPGVALQFTELSIPSFGYTGDRRNACLGRVNAAHAILQLGDYARAERTLRASLADAERMGLHNVSALARQNLGPSLAMQGALGEARAIEMEAIDAFEAQANRRQEGRGRVYLAQILAQGHDLAGAEAEAKAAAARLATIPPLRALALGVLARVLLVMDYAEASLATAREAMDILITPPGGMEEGESLVRLIYAEALQATGNLAAAEDAIAVARKRLLARAGRISDLMLRASFCEGVPENSRTLLLSKGAPG